jgi:hypothetical protein
MMERTAGMSLSSEEKEEFRREEFRKRAKGLKIRLLEDPSKTESILSSLPSESDEDRVLLERLLLQELIDSVSLDRDGLKALDVIAELPCSRADRDLLNSLKNELKSALKGRSKDRKTLLSRERKKLASFGLSGSAVVPKIPPDPHADPEHASETERIKSRLRGLSGP